jgi:hypothetical protein
MFFSGKQAFMRRMHAARAEIERQPGFSSGSAQGRLLETEASAIEAEPSAGLA